MNKIIKLANVGGLFFVGSTLLSVILMNPVAVLLSAIAMLVLQQIRNMLEELP